MAGISKIIKPGGEKMDKFEESVSQVQQIFFHCDSPPFLWMDGMVNSTEELMHSLMVCNVLLKRFIALVGHSRTGV